MTIRHFSALLGAALALGMTAPVLADAPSSPAPMASAASSPAPGSAASPLPSKKYEFTTALKPMNAMGVFGGTLTIYVAADGSIKGTYKPDGASSRSVTGDLKGSDITLIIGQMQSMTITGTLKDGIIDGQTSIRERPFNFHGEPKT
jgi:hypothetical protein